MLDSGRLYAFTKESLRLAYVNYLCNLQCAVLVFNDEAGT